ncbi:methylated-DNA--[protein]-cysteine S-methyltransferase [Hyphomonas sp.]|uniref:methylated-DNA--[protein]-cysteine S-methyltransferase n=1 Tax=Hyphomonas sp. TaxID=87 RepID=UPI00391BB67A
MDPAPFPLDERARAYDRMAKALGWLGDTWNAWPDLDAAARAAGLSPSHFQREFSRWAGVSPRQFQSAIAHAEAGAALRGGASVLEAALEIGLSGPGRLHDLFIAHEALSPGEAKAGGRGADLTLGRAPTPFGMGAWLISPRGLVALGFIDEGAPPRTGFQHQGRREDDAFADLTGRYPGATIRRDDAAAERMARQVFEEDAPLPVCLYGTPFRRQVWRALINIPAGETRTYGALAAQVCMPKAARAVGAAVGANPLSWFIPCHRALAADGRLHNYHWGVDRKRAMLVYERARLAGG